MNENHSLDYQVVTHTWGCKVNTYDTGLLQQRFQAQGKAVVGAKTGAGDDRARDQRVRVHVLNTCAVTQEASREAAREVRRIKSREPFAKVVVTGCGAQVDGGVYDQLPGADLIVANSHKGEIEGLIERMLKGTLEERVFRSNIFRKADFEEGGGVEADHTRSFLKIQDGCNSFCSYCVIPFARGRSRSLALEKLVERAKQLYAMGSRELVLTGVHIGDYGDNESRVQPGQGLEELVRAIALRSGFSRIRLSSLEPVELTEKLLNLYQDPETAGVLCPHFHLSIQSACSATLERMRRQYDALAVEKALLQITQLLPQAFVGMDLIVGFPGETEAEFQETYERLASLPWTRIHVFPYSERPGTKAIALPDTVPVGIRTRRAGQIRALSSARMQKMAIEQLGLRKSCLVLKKATDSERYQLLTRDYWPVAFETDEEIAPGSVIELKMRDFVRPPKSGSEASLKGPADGWFIGDR